MNVRLSIVSVYIMLLLEPMMVTAQGLSITSGAHLRVAEATMILRGNWVNNGNYTDENGTIRIKANTTISGSSDNTFGDLTIDAGATLAIASQNKVTVAGTLTNSADAAGFVLQSNALGTASLMHNTNGVPATVQRYISGATEAWHFLSSPVAAQSISGSWLPSGTYGNGTGYDLYAWNEPSSCWIYKLDLSSVINWGTVHPGGNFVVGRGYLYSVQARNPSKEFAGNLNNGSLNYALTFSSADANLKGFNLVGNPYPSSIDWAVVSGWTRTNLVNSGGGYDMWIWNPAANNYGVCNSATGSGTNSVTRYIASMQGYFVRAASAGNLSMDNNVRIHDGAGNWFKSTSINPSIVSMIVESEGDKSFDEVQLQFGYAPNEEGAAKLFSNVATAPSLYIPVGSKFYSICYLTDTADNPTVPVMFKAGREGNYLLTCNFDVGHFEKVVLEDRQTNYFQNMKLMNRYNFHSSPSDDEKRFVIHFGSDKELAPKELPARVYSDGTSLVIDLSMVGSETTVMIYDAVGRLLVRKMLQGLMQHQLGIKASSQILVVQLQSMQGNKSQKVFYKNKY